MKFQNGQTLLSWEFHSVASAVKPSFKNHERIGHVKDSGPLKSTIIIKILRFSVWNGKDINIMDEIYKKKTFRLAYWWFKQELEEILEDVTVNASDPEATFMASNLWFHRFKARARFRYVKLSSVAANSDQEKQQNFVLWF